MILGEPWSFRAAICIQSQDLQILLCTLSSILRSVMSLRSCSPLVQFLLPNRQVYGYQLIHYAGKFLLPMVWHRFEHQAPTPLGCSCCALRNQLAPVNLPLCAVTASDQGFEEPAIVSYAPIACSSAILHCVHRCMRSRTTGGNRHAALPGSCCTFNAVLKAHDSSPGHSPDIRGAHL